MNFSSFSNLSTASWSFTESGHCAEGDVEPPYLPRD